MEFSLRALTAVILVGAVTSLTASTSAIGLAAAAGSFHVNAMPARGSATVFEGSVIETGPAPSRILLRNGVQLRLGTDSRAQVYNRRAVLEKGEGQFESSSAYWLESRGLRIVSTAPGSIARVQVVSQGKLLVAALRGSVRVAAGNGIVLANLPGGLSLAFDPQVGASAPAQISGCLYVKDSKNFIYNRATRVSVQVTGKDLDKEAGRNLAVAGIEDPATHILAATAWKKLDGGNCRKFAALAPTRGVDAAAEATAGSDLRTATVVILGGVATAATLGGLAFSGNLSSNSNEPNPNPPTSR